MRCSRCRRELVEVDSERNHAGATGEPFVGAMRAASVLQAEMPARRAAPALEPAERDGVALAQVLRGVQHDGRAIAAERAEQRDLGGGERERLLVDVDDVHRSPSARHSGRGS